MPQGPAEAAKKKADVENEETEDVRVDAEFLELLKHLKKGDAVETSCLLYTSCA